MYYVYRSFPIDVKCFRSQRNKRKTELALGGKTLLVIKLDKCLVFFFLSVSKRLRKRGLAVCQQ